MATPWERWHHVTKVDPDKSLRDGDTYAAIADTGTDAIVVGGTTNVTESNVRSILDALSSADVPVFVEPTYLPTVPPNDAFSGYLIPIVLNAGDTTWITGAHHEWIRSSARIDWERTYTEAYIVLNPESAVATYTRANCDLDIADIAAYARLAEHVLNQDIVYLEFSGTLGDPTAVAAARDALTAASLFYGGGIHDYDSAYEMARVADSVVVGDLLHDAGLEAVETTVRGVRDANRT
ncbi:geranylgeranylglyceryl phosphate synthase-like protein [Haladaptatus paucihalophilus DX253]|uniref:Geranylgeranylglyceryl phosphate synthase n=1 Tax=Haladaptatus paucihalophilus DX253 TaxID=797209 RepID=E7QVS9_HALPU|nr:putative phosphoglycerol geranylgeranyltransferase [Haladaptatus paucihalophilus]EFW91342.1 geranylgeranylglyceryl phosphate synthase-like protein [Haladaptatus paucihalophilus DX253]SHL11347.1 phosphoglycerol geranylgeranyltransferase [Haladaptatus paucihalophilus DX253]